MIASNFKLLSYLFSPFCFGRCCCANEDKLETCGQSCVSKTVVVFIVIASSIDYFHDLYFGNLQVQENCPIVRDDWITDILFLRIKKIISSDKSK